MKISWNENGRPITWDSHMQFKMRYKCDGCRAIIMAPDPLFDVGLYFAGVMARREYGRRAIVRSCRMISRRMISRTEDYPCCEYQAFIGLCSKHGVTCGHNIHFVVFTDVL